MLFAEIAFLLIYTQDAQNVFLPCQATSPPARLRPGREVLLLQEYFSLFSASHFLMMKHQHRILRALLSIRSSRLQTFHLRTPTVHQSLLTFDYGFLLCHLPGGLPTHCSSANDK